MYTHFFPSYTYSNKMGRELLIKQALYGCVCVSVILFADKFPKCQTLEDKMMFYKTWWTVKKKEDEQKRNDGQKPPPPLLQQEAAAAKKKRSKNE